MVDAVGGVKACRKIGPVLDRKLIPVTPRSRTFIYIAIRYEWIGGDTYAWLSPCPLVIGELLWVLRRFEYQLAGAIEIQLKRRW